MQKKPAAETALAESARDRKDYTRVETRLDDLQSQLFNLAMALQLMADNSRDHADTIIQLSRFIRMFQQNATVASTQHHLAKTLPTTDYSDVT